MSDNAEEAGIVIGGIGPGSRDYLLPVVKRRAEESQLLLGSRRALELFSHHDKKTVEITADLAQIEEVIEENYRDVRVMVLVSGDPGLYSLADYLRRNFPEEELEIIPGVSSMQLGFARARLSWQDAHFISLHGREEFPRLKRLVEAGEKVGVFTDEENTPSIIAGRLLEAEAGDRRATVAENLSYEEENLITARLSQLTGREFAGLNVMLIHGEGDGDG